MEIIKVGFLYHKNGTIIIVVRLCPLFLSHQKGGKNDSSQTRYPGFEPFILRTWLTILWEGMKWSCCNAHCNTEKRTVNRHQPSPIRTFQLINAQFIGMYTSSFSRCLFIFIKGPSCNMLRIYIYIHVRCTVYMHVDVREHVQEYVREYAQSMSLPPITHWIDHFYPSSPAW